MRRLRVLCVVAATGLFSGPCVRRAAAVVGINWGTPSTISGDTDVDTVGSLLYAYNVGTSGVSSTTVDGETFSSFAISGSTTTVGSLTITTTGTGGSFSSSNSAYGASSAPFLSLSSAYKTLLEAGTTGSSSTNTISVTCGGLTTGQSYTFEAWVNESTTFDNNLSNQTVIHALDSSTLDDNSTDATGGVGEFVTGTLTANGSSASFTLTASGTSALPDLNAIEVIQTPEPTALGFLGFSAIGLLRRRRKTQNAS